MANQPPFCQSYEEARKYFIAGELQAWDGTRWEDVPKEANCFFSRRVEEYRRRPDSSDFYPPPRYVVLKLDPATGKLRPYPANTPRSVGMLLWGESLQSALVFKHVEVTGYDLRKIEEQVEKA